MQTAQHYQAAGFWPPPCPTGFDGAKSDHCSGLSVSLALLNL
jgi:hypothetical protein